MEITPEVIEALRTLRKVAGYSYDMRDAFDTLDNAGIFSAIDREEWVIKLKDRVTELERLVEVALER